MKKVAIENNQLVPIVSDGAIATGALGEGRAIPVLVIDCANHKELLNHIYLHENLPPGDVTSTWAKQRFNSRYVVLILEFTRPTHARAIFRFDLDSQAILADGIVQSCGVYLQPTESGLRVAEGLDKPKILVEVPRETELSNWDELLIKRIRKKMREGGVSRRQSTEAAKETLARMREVWGLRMEG